MRQVDVSLIRARGDPITAVDCRLRTLGRGHVITATRTDVLACDGVGFQLSAQDAANDSSKNKGNLRSLAGPKTLVLSYFILRKRDMRGQCLLSLSDNKTRDETEKRGGTTIIPFGK